MDFVYGITLIIIRNLDFVTYIIYKEQKKNILLKSVLITCKSVLIK